jgi:diphosphomevalonate decarboxylase
MHAVMMTSTPTLYYWQPASLAIMRAVKAWQREGIDVTFTLDAGPNVHVIALAKEVAWAEAQLRALPGVQEVLKAKPGGGAGIIS